MIGYSFGAAVAMLEPDDFASVVVWGQMGDLQAEFHEFLGQDFYDKATAEGVASVDLGWRVVTLKQSFFESLAKHDLADRFAGYSGPFLTIAGDADPAAGYFDQYVGLAAGSTEAVTIPGGGSHARRLQRPARDRSEDHRQDHRMAPGHALARDGSAGGRSSIMFGLSSFADCTNS